MQAVRINSSASNGKPFSADNPAPPSALVLERAEMPQPKPGQALVRVHASTVTRDELTWPESYTEERHILGYDLAGTVESINGDSSTCKPGDEVYGMLSAHTGETWAEYAVADLDRLALKPKNLTWAEATTVPMSSLTAWEALFDKAGLPEPDFESPARTAPSRSVLVTGASGAVGSYVVQLAAAAGLKVVAASSSTERNREFLLSLGATETVEYSSMESVPPTDLIIDTVGGEPLLKAWSVVTDDGTLISVDSSSFAFAQSPPSGKEHVKALFFIVNPLGSRLAKVSKALELGLLRPFLAHTFPLAEARQAYETASGRMDRRGKVVLII